MPKPSARQAQRARSHAADIEKMIEQTPDRRRETILGLMMQMGEQRKPAIVWDIQPASNAG